VLSFLFELGVSCIHHVYYELHPSALFEIYFTNQKKKKKNGSSNENGKCESMLIYIIASGGNMQFK
jgi:hypothetical protein